MIYAILAVSVLLAILFVAGMISALTERGRSDKGRVYLPGFFAWIGGICGGLFLIPTLIVLLATDESVWLSFAFLCFSMLGGTLSLAHLNCRITYDKEGFTHKNLLGIKRTYTYDQITGLKEGNHEDILYMGRRFAMLDEYAVGAMEFEIMVKKRYAALNGGRPIPRVKPKMPDVFNGHVTDGGALIVVYAVMMLLILGFLAFVVCYVYFMPPTAEKCERREVVFLSGTEKKDSLVLTADPVGEEGITGFKIRFPDETLDASAIFEICDSKTPVTVYADYVNPDDEEPYYVVHALSVGDTDLFTFADSQRLHQNEYWPLIPFIGLFAVLWGVYCALSVKVGRNPDRYSRRVIRLFFKDGYVH